MIITRKNRFFCFKYPRSLSAKVDSSIDAKKSLKMHIILSITIYKVSSIASSIKLKVIEIEYRLADQLPLFCTDPIILNSITRQVDHTAIQVNTYSSCMIKSLYFSSFQSLSESIIMHRQITSSLKMTQTKIKKNNPQGRNVKKLQSLVVLKQPFCY